MWIHKPVPTAPGTPPVGEVMMLSMQVIGTKIKQCADSDARHKCFWVNPGHLVSFDAICSTLSWSHLVNNHSQILPRSLEINTSLYLRCYPWSSLTDRASLAVKSMGSGVRELCSNPAFSKPTITHLKCGDDNHITFFIGTSGGDWMRWFIQITWHALCLNSINGSYFDSFWYLSWIDYVL